jgi:hypothetical protein
VRRLLVATLLCLPAFAFAQNAGKKSLRFKVDLGGMNIGQFAGLEMPTHVISMQGDNVLIVPKTNAQDPRPIKLTGGKIGSMMMRILKPREGEQMTVGIAVVPIGAGPGRRCSFTLDHAFLKKLAMDSITLRPSELPKFTCSEK